MKVDCSIILSFLFFELFPRFDIVFNTIGSSAYQFCSNLVLDNGVIIDASCEYYAPVGTFACLHSRMYLGWLKLMQVIIFLFWKL